MVGHTISHTTAFPKSSTAQPSGRAETLAELKTMKWNSADNLDLKVTVFGDAAIAAGDFKSKGIDAAGKAFPWIFAGPIRG